jgi:D-glycerate 3-kinase
VTALKTVADLLAHVAMQARACRPDRPALIGLGGAQGSGKSRQARAFVEQSGLRAAHFSLDDVYLSRAERLELAARVHPLLSTRGPPGTHDLLLAERNIESLRRADPGETVKLPRFDKRIDDRAADWASFAGKPQAILVDGWCMGAHPLASFTAPVNALERDEDRGGAWRAFTRARLAHDYQDFFDRFDAFVYLQAPSFEIVHAWRLQQEEETLRRQLSQAERRALERFIEHYERITRSMLAGAHRANWIAHLDESRRVVSIERRT